MLVGAMTIGTLSDRIGRKKMLLASVVIFTLTQLGAALAPTPEVFGLFRLLGGLGMGGIIPVAAALTIEYSAPKRRSFNYGLMYSGYSLGILVAALAALALLPTLGWRWVIGMAALPVLFLPVLAWIVPESLEYLMSKGRRAEAAALAGQAGHRPLRRERLGPGPVRGRRETGPWGGRNPSARCSPATTSGPRSSSGSRCSAAWSWSTDSTRGCRPS